MYRLLGRAFWEFRARGVDRLYGSSLADTGALEAVLLARRPRSVLEVGCGAGRLVPVYERAGVKRVVGTDIAERALAIARDRHANHTFVRAPADRMRLDERFDLVVAVRVLQHLDPSTVERALASTTRLTDALFLQEAKSGRGHLYLFVHDYDRLLGALGFEPVEVRGDAAFYARRSNWPTSS